jgi:hypothetical protein
LALSAFLSEAGGEGFEQQWGPSAAENNNRKDAGRGFPPEEAYRPEEGGGGDGKSTPKDQELT